MSKLALLLLLFVTSACAPVISAEARTFKCNPGHQQNCPTPRPSPSPYPSPSPLASPSATPSAAPSPSPSPIPAPSPSPVPPPSSGGVPTYAHVFLVVMENYAYGEIIGSSAAPYLNDLAQKGASGGQYFATDHPSLPNYAELTSGQSFPNATSDCDPSASCDSTAANIADRIEASGRSWKAYEESMGAPCTMATTGQYAARHNPFVYYTDITSNQARCQAHVVDYSNLAADLQSAPTTPNYAFITPNVCNDMHDCSIATGDAWLAAHMPAILQSSAFTTQPSLLVVVFDEDDGSQNNHVAMIAVGSGVKVGYTSQTNYNHYSLLKTIETSWQLASLTANDGAAAAMTDIFASSPSPSPSPTPTASPSPSPSATTPGPVGQSGSWNLIFSDEFNSTALDRTKWTPGWFGSGITGPVNSSELACYDSAHVTEAGDGNLHL